MLSCTRTHAGIESECFRENATFENLEAKPFLQVYQSVLNSKATEDSLVCLHLTIFLQSPSSSSNKYISHRFLRN
jgi:hypothetical protein